MDPVLPLKHFLAKLHRLCELYPTLALQYHSELLVRLGRKVQPRHCLLAVGFEQFVKVVTRDYVRQDVCCVFCERLRYNSQIFVCSSREINSLWELCHSRSCDDNLIY